jgi:peptidoglycan/LPS O-acetylase OafA/YrhL
VDGWLYGRGQLVPLDSPLHGSPLAFRVVLGGALEILPGLTAQRVSGQGFSFIPFAWTLRVEFAFYLSAFAVGLAIAWRGRDTTWRRRILTGGLGVAYGAFALFVWRHWGNAAGSGTLQLICVPFFAFGLCLFVESGRPDWASRIHLALVSVGVVLGFTFWGQRGHPVLAYQLPLLAMLFVVLALLSRARLESPALRRWDRRLGELSYPLYISHGVVLTLLSSVSARRGATPYLAAIAAALLLAAALHAVVEQPLRSIRTRLRGAAV